MARRRRKKEPLALFTPAEVREFAERVEDMLDARVSGREPGEAYLFQEGAETLFAAWAASAALCGETSALPTIVHWLQQRDFDKTEDLVARAAVHLAGNDPEQRELLYELGSRRSYRIAHVLTEWLDPAVPAELEVLQEIADDDSDVIAKLARKRLAAFGGLPWWQIAFDEDPTAGLTRKETTLLGPRLRRIVALVSGTVPDKDPRKDGDGSDDDRAEIEAEGEGAGEATPGTLLELVRTLPPRAAVAALVPMLRRAGYRSDIVGMVKELLQHEGGARRFCDLLGTLDLHAGLSIGQGFKELAKVLPIEPRTALVQEATGLLRQMSYEQASDHHAPEHHFVTLLSELWPAELDPAPIVELLLAWGDPEDTKEEHGVGYWSSLFERLDDAHRPLLEPQLRAALAQDLVGRFRVLGPTLAYASQTWPAERRRILAQEVIEAPAGPLALAWAVRTLAELEPEAVLGRIDRPDVREQAFNALQGPLLLHARRMLREGKLSFREAERTLHGIERVWGGIASLLGRFDGRLGRAEREVSDEALAAQAALAALGPPELLGPPSEAEWAEFRRLRASSSWKEIDTAHWGELLVPTGPWDPEDLAWMARVVERYRDHEPDNADFAARVLGKHVCPEILPLLDRLDGLGDEDTQEGVEEIRAHVEKVLGGDETGETEEGEAVEADAGTGTGDDDDW